MEEYLSIAKDVKLGKDVKLAKFINLYGCSIGDNTKIGAFVEVQKGRLSDGAARFRPIRLSAKE